MALLEALPEIVETSLRELREQDETTEAEGIAEDSLGEAVVHSLELPAVTPTSTNGHDALITTLPAEVSSEEADPAEEPSETSQEELSTTQPDDTEEAAPKVLAFATALNAEGAFAPEWLRSE